MKRILTIDGGGIKVYAQHLFSLLLIIQLKAIYQTILI